MKYHGYIYETTNIINGKKYIGQSTIWHRKETYLGSGKLFKSALKKYGKNNFKKQYLAYCKTQKELDKTEQLFIKIYKPEYNIALGGNGKGSISDVMKKKIGNSLKGFKHSADTLIKMSESKKGIKHTKEHIEKLKKNHVGFKGKKHSEEAKQKIGQSASLRRTGMKFNKETKTYYKPTN